MALCQECGFDWDGTQPEQLVDQLRVFPDRFRTPLTRFLPGEDPDTIVRTRPAPGVWSALEYTAHTREALDFYRGRVERIVTGDRPQLTPFDFDAACDDARYNSQDVARVIEELGTAAVRLETCVFGLDLDAWHMTGVKSDGDETTILLLVRRAVHEGQHHLLDIGRALRGVRGRASSPRD